MKVTRALLFSSKKQAETYEAKRALFVPGRYRFLVTSVGEGLRFQIFRMVIEAYVDEQEHIAKRRIPADTAHVDETFKDAGELINYLRRYQIDFEDGWEPVEESE